MLLLIITLLRFSSHRQPPQLDRLLAAAQHALHHDGQSENATIVLKFPDYACRKQENPPITYHTQQLCGHALIVIGL
jgi:hypothetical protein